MEAPLHRSLLPLPASSSWQLQQHDAMMMGAATAADLQQQPSMNAQNPPPPPKMMAGPGREQCPRCASRDTKFCYYNNYNTAQPRHFCRACRRYWTLGGSLRNVPVGGATRKRPRPSSRGLARAAASSSSSFPAGVAAAPAARAQQNVGGLLSSLFLGSAPLLEGLGLGQPVFPFGSTVAGDLLAQLELGFGFGAAPLSPWPATASDVDRAAQTETTTTWKPSATFLQPPSPAAALWQDQLAAATITAPPTTTWPGALLP